MTAPEPAPRGRPRRFDREVALNAAMRVFWEKGFATASMSDLTKAMGINAPSLYAAFGSKEGLYAEAVDHYVATYGQMGADLLAGGGRLRDQIEASLRLSGRAATEAIPAGCLLVGACAERAELSEETARALSRKRLGPVETLEARLRRGVEQGELPPRADVAALAHYIATIQRGLAISTRGGAGPDEVEAVVKTTLAAWDAMTGSS